MSFSRVVSLGRISVPHSLDWLLIVNERHLRQVLAEFFDHYNRSRPHLALGLRPPCPEDVPAQGAILRRRRLHGLINEYSRAA